MEVSNFSFIMDKYQFVMALIHSLSLDLVTRYGFEISRVIFHNTHGFVMKTKMMEDYPNFLIFWSFLPQDTPSLLCEYLRNHEDYFDEFRSQLNNREKAFVNQCDIIVQSSKWKDFRKEQIYFWMSDSSNSRLKFFAESKFKN